MSNRRYRTAFDFYVARHQKNWFFMDGQAKIGYKEALDVAHAAACHVKLEPSTPQHPLIQNMRNAGVKVLLTELQLMNAYRRVQLKGRFPAPAVRSMAM